MRYVQSLPPIVEPVPDSGAARPAAQVGPVPAVGPRNLPPMIYRQRQHTEPSAAINRRWAPRSSSGLADRRRYCRRLVDGKVLQELRSEKDRRTHCERADDITTAIDEKI